MNEKTNKKINPVGDGATGHACISKECSNSNSKIKILTSDHKAITLIALIITIIVMLILVGVTINSAINGGLFGVAKEATFKTELSKLKEELEVYKATKMMTIEDFEETSLSANKLWLFYEPGGYITNGTIKEVMPSISDEMKEKIEVLNGDIMFSGSEKEIAWAKEIGINKTVKIENGVLLSDNDNLSILSEDGTFTVPSTVEVIGEGAFANTNVRKVVIPYTVKEISQNAFNGNATLEEVEFQTKEIDGEQQGVETIGNSAFYGCSNLKEITLPNTLTEIGNDCFKHCLKLTKVVLSNKLKVLSNELFYNCIELKNIDIPEGIETIGNNTFAACKNLSNIYIPESVNNISTVAFRNCTALKNIEIDSLNNTYTMTDGILMNKTGTSMIFMLESASAINGSTFTIPEKVGSLPVEFLNNFSNVTKVIIPASVNSINTGFFTKNIKEIEINDSNPKYKVESGMILSKDGTTLVYYYANEATVNVPNSVTTIAQGALNNTGGSNVMEVILPEKLTILQYKAISCSKLKSIDIGEEVSSIDPLAFGSEITLNIAEGNIYYLFEEGVLYKDNKTVLTRCFKDEAEVIIPEGVVTIGYQAFQDKKKLKTEKIPETVKKIESMAFRNCSELEEIEIPSSVSEIGNDCFQGCSKLTKIKIHKAKDSISGAPWGAVIGERAIEWLGE